jgi:hypothetical protein
MALTSSDWITIIGLLVTLTAFIAGLFQYRQAQRWKALEFISGEIKEFVANRDVRNTTLMLERNRRPINFLSQFTNESNGEEKTVTVIVSDEMILSTLTYRLRKGSVTKEEGYIRDTFNTFFFYLSNFNHYIQVFGLVKYSDLHPYLGYWLEILSGKTNRKPAEFAEVVQQYLEDHRYYGVQQLIRRHQAYTIKHPSQNNQQRVHQSIEPTITETTDKKTNS